MINKKRFFTIMLILCTLLLSTNILAYSGLLDDFDGWDFSHVGNYAIDDFTLSDDDLYVQISISESYFWDNFDQQTGMIVEACRKNWLGAYVTQDSNSFTRSVGDTSDAYLNFTGLDTGTYKMYFKAYYYGDIVAFDGNVWDNN